MINKKIIPYLYNTEAGIYFSLGPEYAHGTSF